MGFGRVRAALKDEIMADPQLQNERFEIQRAASGSKKEIAVLELYMMFILIVVCLFLYFIPQRYLHTILGYPAKVEPFPGHIPATKF